ncbi:cysteine desulfurase family protein [Botrimarina sp.]|uniref:cysteine desulfurase family protein n=1 Tax=Botrimarina sp. TaxID=2795802 RepID=UPI0032EF3209
MPARTIYLDHNATSPLSPAAAEAMQAAWREAFANPSSQHAAGRVARRTLEEARAQIVRLLGGDPSGRSPDRLVFTSGGTEANTLALRGLMTASGKERLIISAMEHPSIQATADALADEGYRVDRIGLTNAGVVRLDQLEGLLAEASREVGLVSVIAASNETGVLQPIGAIAQLCASAGVWLHTDATQLAGKHPLEFRYRNLTAATIAAHKFNGPLGVGALLLAPAATPAPVLRGGFQQAGLRAGTESAAMAVGMAVALQEWADKRTERVRRLQDLRDELEQGLAASWLGGAVVLGSDSPRLEHTTCVALPGADRQALVMAYDLAGVACSTGSACASGSTERSPTLLAMGLDETLVDSAVRFSLGATTTAAEIDDAVRRIVAVNRRLRAGTAVCG